MRWPFLILPCFYLALCVASVVAIFVSVEPLVGLYAYFLGMPWSRVIFMLIERTAIDSIFLNLALFGLAFTVNAVILYFIPQILIAAFAKRFGGKE